MDIRDLQRFASNIMEKRPNFIGLELLLPSLPQSLRGSNLERVRNPFQLEYCTYSNGLQADLTKYDKYWDLNVLFKEKRIEQLDIFLQNCQGTFLSFLLYLSSPSRMREIRFSDIRLLDSLQKEFPKHGLYMKADISCPSHETLNTIARPNEIDPYVVRQRYSFFEQGKTKVSVTHQRIIEPHMEIELFSDDTLDSPIFISAFNCYQDIWNELSRRNVLLRGLSYDPWTYLSKVGRCAPATIELSAPYMFKYLYS